MDAPTSTTMQPSRRLQWISAILPLLKCAICPACLSVWSGVLAGARLGVLDESTHHGLLVGAIVFDIVILDAARKHHADRGPLLLCVASGAVAVGGHQLMHSLEYVGLAGLFVAALWNMFLLRRVHQSGQCCAHDHGHGHGQPKLQRAQS